MKKEIIWLTILIVVILTSLPNIFELIGKKDVGFLIGYLAVAALIKFITIFAIYYLITQTHSFLAKNKLSVQKITKK